MYRIQAASRSLQAVFLALLAAIGVQATDQTEYLKKEPQVLRFPATYFPRFPSSSELPFNRARDLVRDTLNPMDLDDPKFYCVIHVLEWDSDPSKVKRAKWYLYRGQGQLSTPSGSWSSERFKGTRIYGTENVAVLYVHLNVPAKDFASATRPAVRAAAFAGSLGTKLQTLSQITDQDLTTNTRNALSRVLTQQGSEIVSSKAGSTPSASDIRTRAEAQIRSEVLDQSNRDLPDDPRSAVQAESARGQALTRLGDTLIEKQYANVVYQIDVTKKLPSNVQNLQSLLGLFQAARAAKPQVDLDQNIGLWAAEQFTIEHIPSDIKVSGKLTIGEGDSAKTVDLGNCAYDNEGLYYWDVSIAVPVQRVSELSFATDNGAVFVKEVDKQHLFALFNLFLKPVDTKGYQKQFLPHPVVGVAITSKPLDKFLVGGAFGVNKVQVFVGAVFNRVEVPATLAPGDPATPGQLQQDLTRKYDKKLQVGLNVPVRQIVEFLKGKK